jgi:hypothetical protein
VSADPPSADSCPLFQAACWFCRCILHCTSVWSELSTYWACDWYTGESQSSRRTTSPSVFFSTSYSCRVAWERTRACALKGRD